MTSISVLLYAGSAIVCLIWAIMIVATGRGFVVWLLAASCACSGLWAASVAISPMSFGGLAGLLEISRWMVWSGLLLVLYRRVAGERARDFMLRFAAAAAVSAMVAAALQFAPGLFAGSIIHSVLGSPTLLFRLGFALLIVLLAENIYRAADRAQRWHVSLPCVAIGGLCAYDVFLYADAALSQGFSPALLDGRAVLTAFATPLLGIAAAREKRWRRDPPISRQVVFHGATLVVAGAFLLAIGALGEALKQFDKEWGPTAQVSLFAAAAIGVAVAATSGTARSRLRCLIVDPFFASRYDYRREWLRTVGVLSSADEGAAAEHRAIRAIADAVDSPAGVLLRCEPDTGQLQWAGSWNAPGVALMRMPDALPAGLFGGEVTVFAPGAPAPAALREAYGQLWLAVPLLHARDGLAAIVLLAPPRAPFRLDQEVFELLIILGREVAMFLAERQSAETLADSRRLQDYAKRFAFVAHDVKTVSSQLSMLLANAEDNLQDREFQSDMLLTVRASADRINALIARLGQPGDPPKPATEHFVWPARRLRAIAASRPYPVQIEETGLPAAMAAISAESFDTAIGHLINNAAEASPSGAPLQIQICGEAGRITIDITDLGRGMTPEFVRDELFRPLSTSKRSGTGIGAWQARDILLEAGCELQVLSRVGAGTTMRVSLPTSQRLQEPEHTLTRLKDVA